MDTPSTWTLRSFAFLIAAFTAVNAVAAQPGPPPAANTPAPQLRMRWQDFIAGPQGAKRLASLETAVKKMKSLDSSAPNSADFRRSWKYWANIHGYYGPQSPDGTLAQQLQYLQSNGLGSDTSFYQSITDQTPPDATAKSVWATCQHSEGTGPKQANFFAWHRMYLYYFERVLRWAANDNTLRLPYWDYTNPAQEAIPARFRLVSSALYDPNRDAPMNQGTSKLNSNSTNVDTKLKNANFLTYEYDVETTIHGYVHCTVGPTCPVSHMGDVPVAGNDPLFYSHHANIDRLWACWQHLHPTPAGAWQNQKFSFPDETGNLQTDPVSKFLDTTALGYAYDNIASCSRAAVHPAALQAHNAQPTPPANDNSTVVASTQAISITNASTSVDIPAPAVAPRTPPGPSTSELVLRDISAQSSPGTLLDVYIAKKGQPATRKFVGTINWFGAFRHHGMTGPDQRTLSFDVTSQLRALGITPGSSAFTVTFQATNGRVSTGGAATSRTAGNASTVRPEAKLQVGAIELRRVPQ
jgi:hypothetical protein